MEYDHTKIDRNCTDGWLGAFRNLRNPGSGAFTLFGIYCIEGLHCSLNTLINSLTMRPYILKILINVIKNGVQFFVDCIDSRRERLQFLVKFLER